MRMCQVVRLYWDDLDVWLSEIQIGAESNNILRTTYSSNHIDALSFYMTGDDHRYRNGRIILMNQLIREGLSVKYDEVPLRRYEQERVI